MVERFGYCTNPTAMRRIYIDVVKADDYDALAARLAEAERDLAITREALAATQDALDAKNQVDRTDADRAADSASGVL